MRSKLALGGLPVALALLLGLGLSRPALADCRNDGVALFPAPGSTVPTNSRFILQGFGADQKAVEAEVGQILYLRSSEDSVPVKVGRAWKSAMNESAVLLVPTRPLRPVSQYRLVLTGPAARKSVINSGPGQIAWRTGHGPDREPPEWVEKPSASEGEYSLENHELARHVTLHLVTSEQSPAFLVVTMRRLRGAVGIQRYFVPVDGEQAVLGHDGCHGSFAFEDGGAYRAKVELFDAAGNHASPAEVEFLAPARSR